MNRFVISSITVCATAFFVFGLLSTNDQLYTPVSERTSISSYGAKGALEYLHRLKANSDGEIPK